MFQFCMDTVKKFCHTGKHGLILRAGNLDFIKAIMLMYNPRLTEWLFCLSSICEVEVFMAYYSSCSPSVSFSEEVVNSLLSSLLNFCLLREFDAVINLLLKHKRRVSVIGWKYLSFGIICPFGI